MATVWLMLPGVLVAASGIALAWPAFTAAWRYDLALQASEDPSVGYGAQWGTVFRASAISLLLVALLAIVAWSVFYSVYAVAMARTPREGQVTTQRHAADAGGLWRAARPHISGVSRTLLLGAAYACGPALVGIAVYVAVEANLFPGIEPSWLTLTTSWKYVLVGRCLPLVLAVLGVLIGCRFMLAPASLVATGAPVRAALRNSWTLTGRAPWRTTGVCALLISAAVAVFTVLRLALTPLTAPLHQATLDLTDGNRYTADAIGDLTPPAVALMLLPTVVMPVVCRSCCAMYTLLAGVTTTADVPHSSGFTSG